MANHQIDVHDIRRRYPLPDAGRLGLFPPNTRRTLKAANRARTRWKCACPYHGGDNPDACSFYDGPSGWRFRCFTRGCSGDILDLVQNAHGLDFAGAVVWLTGQTLPRSYRADPAPEPEPARTLSDRVAQAYHQRLETVIDPATGLTARAWWHARGVTDEVLAHYRLGFAPRCPTFRTSPSATIPVVQYGGLIGIRHRLLAPPRPQDKYRPEFAGQDVALFNLDHAKKHQNLIIVDGEIKVLVLTALGFGSQFGLISATGGMATWTGALGPQWRALLGTFEQVIVWHDTEPGAEDVAWQVARLWGRRGFVTATPGKPDDYLIEPGVDPEQRLRAALDALAYARPVRA